MRTHPQLKVLKIVVMFDAVLVMDRLVGQDCSTKMFAHNERVLEDILSARRVRMLRKVDPFIAIWISIATSGYSGFATFRKLALGPSTFVMPIT